MHYYPFGMVSRNVYSGFQATDYRYGFNGKENDKDVKGSGDQIDYGARIYDPRLGKFLSVDPLTKNFPHYTPYQFAGNNPISNIDLDGEEEKYFKLKIDEKTGKTDLELVRTVDQKSFLGFSWTPTLTYYVTYPQGPFGSKSYTFTKFGGAFTQENTIENFDSWINLDHSDPYDRPEYVFASNLSGGIRSFNAAADVAVQNGAVGRFNSAGKTFSVSTTNKAATQANGSNPNPARTNAQSYSNQGSETIDEGTRSTEQPFNPQKQKSTITDRQKTSVKSESVVRERLEKQLQTNQTILIKPRFYLSNGSYSTPDFAIYNTKTNMFEVIPEAKNGNGVLTNNQSLLNSEGGQFRGSSRYPLARPQQLPSGRVTVEKTSLPYHK